jgi:hypothetical protein
MKNLALIAMAALFVCGCETTKIYQVQMDSDPQGMRVYSGGTAKPKRVNKKHPIVEVAKDYLGTTPFTASITGDGDGHFKLPKIAYMSDYVGGTIVFTAVPPARMTNLNAQSFTFRGHTDYVGGDVIPHGIFFDMAQPATDPVTAESPKASQKSIKVETDPPGMRIFFCVATSETNAMEQREYVGQSPCVVTVETDAQDRFVNKFSSFLHPVAVFMAEPPSTSTNLYAQRQEFQVPAAFHKAVKAPDAVFFDMHKPAPAP